MSFKLGAVRPAEDIQGNNILACLQNSSSPTPGEQELFINVTNVESGWGLDYITFESLLHPVLDGEVLQVGNGELSSSLNYDMLSFGPDWERGSTGTSTNIVGSKAMVKFNGKKIYSTKSL